MERVDGWCRVTRADIEDFLYHEAALLDEWRLDEWLALLTDDAVYRVPSNDAPDGGHEVALYTIADDIQRIRARVKRLQSNHAHAEFPHSRTRRMISNVRLLGEDNEAVLVAANFVVYRFRRESPLRAYVGSYRYKLAVTEAGLRIAERIVRLDATELAALGSVSFIL
jgi:p-cumate 2,3-dioxygenase beta subunit